MTGLEMKYFILKPHGTDAFAAASRNALLSFANAIEKENLALAFDLTSWVGRCQKEALEAPQTVKITQKEYDKLLKDQELLDALRAEGVDNWDGWDYAIERLGEEE